MSQTGEYIVWVPATAGDVSETTLTALSFRAKPDHGKVGPESLRRVLGRKLQRLIDEEGENARMVLEGAPGLQEAMLFDDEQWDWGRVLADTDAVGFLLGLVDFEASPVSPGEDADELLEYESLGCVVEAVASACAR